MNKKLKEELEKLPEDCIKTILMFFDSNSLCELSLVSKKFILTKFSENDIFWKEPFEKLLNFYHLDKDKFKFQSIKKEIPKIHKEFIKKLSNYHPNTKNQQFLGFQPFLSKFYELELKFYKDENLLKFGFFGESQTGKSRLVAKIDGQDFSKYKDKFFPKLWTSKEITLSYRNLSFKIHPLDTNGSYLGYNVSHSWIRDPKLIILCFSVVDRESYNSIEGWIHYAKYRYGKETLCLLIGTKIDLRDDDEFKKKMKDEEKIISFQEGEELAKKTGCILYFEVSSKLGIGIEELKRIIVTVTNYDSVKNIESDKKKCLLQ